MKIKPAKGMNDYLPSETRLRDYLQKTILKTYTKYGFERIQTPILEDIENLDKSDGGENLGLMFRILKRGDKLKKALELDSELCDMGLRYDLTLPLSRYYANNKQSLMPVFKSIQIDRVYRAEQPQKGRLREFVQCDIDIIGDSSSNAETELIYVTAQALLSLEISNFNIRINDKRLLIKVLEFCGFLEEDFETVCISIDKLNKIGVEGVTEELLEKINNTSAVNTLKEFLLDENISLKKVSSIINDNSVIKRLKEIIDNVRMLSDSRYKVSYDFSLVRGQGYYTGTVFEIESNDYNCSIAGGGRYDNLIKKFTKESIPAVGFSIGFERIYSLLKDKLIINSNKTAIVYYCDVIYAIKYSEKIDGETCLIKATKKLGKLINTLENNNYDSIVVINNDYSIKQYK